MGGEGFHFDVLDKPKRETSVKKTFLRTDSIGRVLLLDLPFDRDIRKLIKVKLEIDTNPPVGSGYETRYVTFLRNISSDDLKAHSEPFLLGQAVEVHVRLIKLILNWIRHFDDKPFFLVCNFLIMKYFHFSTV